MTQPGEFPIPLILLASALLLQVCSGFPLIFRPGSAAAHRFSALLLVAGSVCAAAGGAWALAHPDRNPYLLELGLPFGPAEIGVDPLSGFFLLPVSLVTGCSALYGLGYWPASRKPRNAGRLSLFLGFLAASMTGLFLARSAVLFLMAWEVMALAAFFALCTEDEKSEVRQAGLLYLITTHLGALALFATFALLHRATGSFGFPVPGTVPAASGVASAIFLSAVLGFGLKAGAMPFHVWLPSAHANAPSHVSAVLSAVVLKTGIYGLIRICSFCFGLPLWWGALLLVAGMVSGILGVAFAIGQHDLKRLLAYHSIENIGIILMGMGIALIGQSAGNQVLMTLGMAGALLHVLNHATFKALLFLAAGSVIHATGTREIELMGGVARRLPYSATFFLVGAVAICGLPPLNGFVSELMVYLGGFSSIRFLGGIAGTLPALAAPALALIGGLAVACFVKVYGVVFLGTARGSTGGKEASGSMLAPMALLSLVCALIGLAPFLVSPALEQALASYAPVLHPGALPRLLPMGWISWLGILLVLMVFLASHFLLRRSARGGVEVSRTWGCGYLRPTPRMQYSASSFAEMLVSWFSAFLRPELHREDVKGLFPQPGALSSHVPETVLERVYLPFLEYLYLKSAPLRRLQHGRLNIYICYTFVTLILLMAVTGR